RGVSQVERRIVEATRLGFKSCLMPKFRSKPSFDLADVQLVQVGSVTEALRLGLARGSDKDSTNGEDA
ncbi:MAG TPA: hypothetical protein VEG43_03220, partial [Dehalococcoidia bacterium]|nr:hypothetical protein [Dehalococcoidia bacterium]